MTNREFYNAIIAGEMSEEVRAQVIEHANTELTKLDERNRARAEKPSKTQEANEPIKAKIREFLLAEEEWQTASMISEALEISVQKASALCRQMVADGFLTVQEIKVPKKGKQKAYMLTARENDN